MKELIKTIDGSDCRIFAIKNHQRFFLGTAAPTVEIYQNITEVKILGRTSSQYKTYEFSVIICSNPEIVREIEFEGLNHFELKMLLKRKDDVFVPFEFAGLTDFSIDAFEKWIFNVNDYELTQKLILL